MVILHVEVMQTHSSLRSCYPTHITHKKTPKTTGRETFGDAYSEKVSVRADELGICPEDVVATVTKLTVETIIKAYKTQLPGKIDAVYVSGGGAKNPLIVERLRNELNVPVYDYSTLGRSGEAKEALLVALLANENVIGLSLIHI